MVRVMRGTWRTTFVFRALGLAVKVPNVRIRLIWDRYKDVRSIGDFAALVREDITYWYYPACSLKCLFGGWVMNLREARFSASDGAGTVIQPTYASLFGVANIMPAGRPHSVPEAKLWTTAQHAARPSGLDPHTWRESRNFVRDGRGHLRLVDYGDMRTQQAIRNHRSNFAQAFTHL